MQLPNPFMLSMDRDGVITVAYNSYEDARIAYDALEGQPFSASLPADTAELVERLRESALGHGPTEGGLRARAASLIQSQAARIAALEVGLRELERDATEASSRNEAARILSGSIHAARALLNRRAEG